MKRSILFTIIFLTSICGYSQVSVGIRDTRYINASYTLANALSFKLEQSIYSEKMECQYARVYVDYKTEFISSLRCETSVYAGMAWNNNYRNAGAMIGLDYLMGRMGIYGIVNPHYDSFFKYKTFFRGGLLCKLTDQINLKCDYNTIPVYREEERRIRFGFTFTVANLTVEPMITMPIDGNEKFKSWRVPISMTYTF